MEANNNNNFQNKSSTRTRRDASQQSQNGYAKKTKNLNIFEIFLLKDAINGYGFILGQGLQGDGHGESGYVNYQHQNDHGQDSSTLDNQPIYIQTIFKNTTADQYLKLKDEIVELYLDGSDKRILPNSMTLNSVEHIIKNSNKSVTLVVRRAMEQEGQRFSMKNMNTLQPNANNRYNVSSSDLNMLNVNNSLDGDSTDESPPGTLSHNYLNRNDRYDSSNDSHSIPLNLIKSRIFYRITSDSNYNSLTVPSSSTKLYKNDILYLKINQNTYHKNVQYLQKIDKLRSNNNLLILKPDIITLTPEFISNYCKKVCLLEANFYRPVCILGPFTDIICQYLIKKFGKSFGFVEPNENNSIETGEVLKVINEEKHPICVVTPEVADKMIDHADFYPITIYIYTNENIKITNSNHNQTNRKSNLSYIRQNIENFDHYYDSTLINGYCQYNWDVLRDYAHLLSKHCELEINRSNITTWKDDVADLIKQEQDEYVWVNDFSKDDDLGSGIFEIRESFGDPGLRVSLAGSGSGSNSNSNSTILNRNELTNLNNQTSSSHTQNHLNTSLSQLLSPKIKFNFAEKFDDLKIISNFRNEKLLGLRRTKNLGFAVIEMEGDKTVRIGQISSKSLLRKVFLSFF